MQNVIANRFRLAESQHRGAVGIISDAFDLETHSRCSVWEFPAKSQADPDYLAGQHARAAMAMASCPRITSWGINCGESGYIVFGGTVHPLTGSADGEELKRLCECLIAVVRQAVIFGSARPAELVWVSDGRYCTVGFGSDVVSGQRAMENRGAFACLVSDVEWYLESVATLAGEDFAGVAALRVEIVRLLKEHVPRDLQVEVSG